MEAIRIAIIDSNNIEVLTFLDNTARNCLHYYDDVLHPYLEGSAATMTLKVQKDHPDKEFIAVGNYLSFRRDGTGYFLSIMQAIEKEYYIEVTAYSGCFELLNQTAPSYKAASAMTFVQYMTEFGFNTNILSVGINEVSTKKITNEWTGTSDTILKRLFSLATLFSAEIEFVYNLNQNYTLGGITLNTYKQHSDTQQGIGSDRSDITLRYGVNVSGITRTSDITELYTAITPYGKDANGNRIDIRTKEETITDEDGVIEYQTKTGWRRILAVKAMGQFPSNITGDGDKYIDYIWETDYKTVNQLYGQALAKLKEISKPQVSYEVESYADLHIGDTVIIYDEMFTPALYLSARVVEQEISFTDPSKNKTKFVNFTVMASEVSTALLSLQQMLANVSIKASALNLSAGTATLLATLRVDGIVTQPTSYSWTLAGESTVLGTSETLAVTDLTKEYICTVTW